MKILIGHLYHESNTFSPFPTTKDSFEFYEGEEMIDKLFGSEVLREEGVEIIPSVYAARWSSGTVEQEAYEYYEQKILDVVRQNRDNLDGIWLSLHGGMTVAGIGSGEYRILRDVREIVGNQLPISISLDMHANNQEGIQALTNIMNGYHTAPHVDTAETQKKAARALVRLIRSGEQGVHPQMVRVPMLLFGERAISSDPPFQEIYDRCRELEADPRILAATLYVGMAWGDTPNTSVTVAVTPSKQEYADFAEQEAQSMADYLFERRNECRYAHPSYLPEEAVKRAVESENSPLFLSDSGDNPTAGGVGNNTVLLELMLHTDLKGKKVLFAPIYDSNAVELLKTKQPGETVAFSIGMNWDENSRPVPVTGEILRFGEIWAYHELTYEKKADYAMVRIGTVDVILADHQLSFTGMECFETAGVTISDYDILVLKMGYLFAEIADSCRENMMALTPGCTPLLVTTRQYHHLPRPIWPLDME
ncbi:MAG: M81 family metallopeptidase [Massiliimalia sp.]|jgi:microcystin degradation protein MlrC